MRRFLAPSAVAEPKHRPRPGSEGVLSVAALLLVAGCAGHAARTEGARTALDQGRPKEALRLLNEELDVDSPAKVPEKTSGDNAVLLLDRAMVLQAIASKSEAPAPREYGWSSRDLEVADSSSSELG